jgi:hypothetical protein
MATVGNTIVDFEGLQKAGIEEQLQAVADLARILELMAEGRCASDALEIDGDPELLQSLIWPLRSIAGAALDNYRKDSGKEVA